MGIPQFAFSYYSHVKSFIFLDSNILKVSTASYPKKNISVPVESSIILYFK